MFNVNPKTIIYFPLEPYKERYTIQLSAKDNGWMTRNWTEYGINFHYIEGTPLSSDNTIVNGSVLDCNGRGYWACSQIMDFLKKFNNGEFDVNNSVIYIEDFFHPGIEALAYAFHITGRKIPIYTLVHAQSVDCFDFTHSMRSWMRHYEKCVGNFADGIFVTSTILKDLLIEHGVAPAQKVHITGLPYNSACVKEMFPREPVEKKDQVVFSSRLDWEKNPSFFASVATKLRKKHPEINVVFTTSASTLRSNDPYALKLFEHIKDKVGKGESNLIDFRIGQTKEQYYQTLLESKVQFNCAFQDFVSWTLLESLTAGCMPVYPFFRSFPEVLPREFMYIQENSDAAVELIVDSIRNFDTRKNVLNAKAIVRSFDASWERMYEVMTSGRLRKPLFDAEESTMSLSIEEYLRGI